VLGIASALWLTPVFAAIGLPTLTAPFILACWLVRAATQKLGKATVALEPCAPGENQPRLR
jgi:urea transporter